MRNASVIVLATMFLFLVGCVGPGDIESVDSVQRSTELYQRDVMGGQTPAEASATIDDLANRYSEALADNPDHDDLLRVFRADLQSFYVDDLSYSLALEYFDAALRYELSKFPPDKRPEVPPVVP